MRINLLAAGLFLALLAAVITVVDMTRIPDMYSVKGEAEIKYMPDTAIITAGVIQTADTSSDAVQAVADGMTKVLDALKAAGVPDADIATRSVETHVVLPDADRDQKKAPHLYYAGQMIEVKLHDLSLVSKISGRTNGRLVTRSLTKASSGKRRRRRPSRTRSGRATSTRRPAASSEGGC